mmetsp:Transcript_4556/g.15167  ORF Transcript_4556/g.15167 Transcript_4556/m.15167 type:complete len:448 (-) Transcript_4556:3061-4404(-)
MLLTMEGLTRAFEVAFPGGSSSGGPLGMAAAPGRANIIGEHTDYQEGFVTPFSLEERCYLVYRPTGGTRVRAYAADLDERGEADLADMARKRGTDPLWGSQPDDFTETSSWIRYVAGPMEWVRTALGRPEGGGCDVLITSTVPLGGGVSSSSALSVAATVAARDLLLRETTPVSAPPQNGKRKKIEMLTLACEAEWHYSGVRGGIMDQFASLNGRRDGALVLDCRTRRVSTLVPFPAEKDAGYLIINTNVKHSLVDSPYAKRREACERVAKKAALKFPASKITHLRDLSDLGADEGLALLGQLDLTDEERKRATHGVLENCRVAKAVACADRGDWPAFGELLDEAHASLRDLYEVSCPELDAACQSAKESPFCLGARLMGGGFGGCAIALCTDLQKVADHVTPRYKHLTERDATVFPARPGPGAQLRVIGDDGQATWVPVFDVIPDE